MAILNRLFGRADRPDKKKTPTNLAFVLLSEPRCSSAEQIARSFAQFAGHEERVVKMENRDEPSGRPELRWFQFSKGERAFAGLLPTPVPNREADEAARFSISSFGTGWKLRPHSAHLLVTLIGTKDTARAVRLSRFTSLLAAVVESAPAVGVYWGDAGATHDPKFFTSVAADPGIVPRLMLWSGVSIARERDGRLSLLSLGMKQLNLPDLLLVAGKTAPNVALETLFDLLAYVAQRGQALPEGDTVGRTAEERHPVRYLKSPLDAKQKVWRVELP